MKSADLHIHTYYSDSSLSPKEVVEEASQRHLDCIAITDHDTIDGISPAREAALGYGIEVLAGIEFSSQIHGKDVHILGYLFDHADPEITKMIGLIQNSRIDRMRAMIGKLNDLGINNIDFEEVQVLVNSKSIGRPHLATVLMQKGWVRSRQEAFDKYLADGAPACVQNVYQSPAEAVELIKNAGGVAVLAHPMITKIDELIPELVRKGLDGLEAAYPNASRSIADFYKNLARKYDLIITGGSDSHGNIKRNTWIGKMTVDYEIVEQLKQKAIK